MRDRYPLYLANKPLQPNADLAVVDKFTDKVAAHVALADKALLDQGYRRCRGCSYFNAPDVIGRAQGCAQASRGAV